MRIKSSLVHNTTGRSNKEIQKYNEEMNTGILTNDTNTVDGTDVRRRHSADCRFGGEFTIYPHNTRGRTNKNKHEN